MVPFETLLTMQPRCVQIAVNALNDPDSGCVITMFTPSMILPPPSGIWEVVARAALPPVAGALLPTEVAVPPAAGADPPLLTSWVVHPASIAAHVTPAPASTARRPGSWLS
jgi:hypothetical protein